MVSWPNGGVGVIGNDGGNGNDGRGHGGAGERVSGGGASASGTDVTNIGITRTETQTTASSRQPLSAVATLLPAWWRGGALSGASRATRTGAGATCSGVVSPW